MRLTLYSDYSLRVLLYLCQKQGKAASITEIADFYQISKNHLMKIVSNLRAHGFISTERGRGGGVWLACPAETTTVGEVARHTEPDFNLLECFNPETDHCVITSSCRLKSVLHEANAAFIGVLDRYTLADMASVQASAFRSIPIRSP